MNSAIWLFFYLWDEMDHLSYLVLFCFLVGYLKCFTEHNSKEEIILSIHKPPYLHMNMEFM